MMNAQEELVVIKGKRTKRPRPLCPLGPITSMPSPTSNSSAGTSNTNNSGELIDVATTRSATTTSEYELEDEDMAYCLILLAQGHHHHHHHTHKASPSSKHVSASTEHDHNDHNNSLYKCKTCNRCFPSFQALGGHRASHKKPNNKSKGAYGIEEKQERFTSFVSELDGDHDHHCDPTTTSTILSLQLSSSNNRLNLYGTSRTTSKPSATAKSKLHECSICGAEFSSGQALGGHMRRHRNILSTSTTPTSISGGNINIIGSTESQEAKKPRNVLKLDLNLPAAPEGDHQRESKFSFQTKENVIVFSAPSLVDCHY